MLNNQGDLSPRIKMAKGTYTLLIKDIKILYIATHAFQDGSQYNYRPVQSIVEFNVNIMEAARCLASYMYKITRRKLVTLRIIHNLGVATLYWHAVYRVNPISTGGCYNFLYMQQYHQAVLLECGRAASHWLLAIAQISS